jgi:pimeloyl-ACP methyl ester carboxylesterase
MDTKEKVNGSEIFYKEHGENNTKHILFIHGLGSSSITWNDIPQALSEQFHTIAVDLIGFGNRDKPKADYTIPYFSQFIKDFLKKNWNKKYMHKTDLSYHPNQYLIEYGIIIHRC